MLPVCVLCATVKHLKIHLSFFSCRLSSDTSSAETEPADGPGPAQPWYQMFTTFRPWSVCDRCGVQGEQLRIGLCYIRSHTLHVRYRGAQKTTVSCGSGGVPKAIRRMRKSRAAAKMEVRSCQAICPSPSTHSSRIGSLLSFIGFK